jgi:hypothetical protein
MYKDLTAEELDLRLKRFCGAMDGMCPDWDTAVILSKVNQYYFTARCRTGFFLSRRTAADTTLRAEALNAPGTNRLWTALSDGKLP